MKKNFITCVSFLSIMSLFSCSSEKEFNRWGDKLTQYVVEEYMPAKDYIWNWNEAVFLKSAVVRCENNMDKDYLFHTYKQLSTPLSGTPTVITRMLSSPD